MREITVGVVAPAYVNVPLWIAQERGFLERSGLAATERICGTTHGATSALRDGEVDIALTAPEGSIADAVAGGPLRVVAGLTDRPPLSMIALPRHHTFKDLRGGRIGTSSLTEGTRHVAERMLAAHGLTYPADYDFALEGSHVERWKALQAGTIDAALQMIPYDFM
ncbi:MAG TPA: ABC transporter substrate-binding protein, partial [Streptosporangiaceae bacterium]